ncbi:hypothetical protein ACTXT7_004455 [Hymenolepis weldensis]
MLRVQLIIPPTVVILPGITGCGCCSYIASLVKEINNCKYRCVVLNNRGTCRYKIKTPKTFCASHTSDVSMAMEHVRNRYPKSSLIAVGVSLGGILTFNYIAQEQKDSTKSCPLTAAMCISMPWDIGMSCDKLEKSFDRVLFNYPMVHNLRQLIARNAEVLSKQFGIPHVLKSRTVREFDESLTVEMFGYNSLEEYHADATPATKIGRVKVPVLCLNAADDPYVPMESIPLEKVQEGSSNVTIALTRHGGHIGFLAGFLPTGPNFMDRAVSQYVSAVFENKEEFDQIVGEYTAKLVTFGLIGAYTAYYFLAARSPPVLYGRSKKLLNFFRSHVPFLNEIYSPFVFGFTGRIQTVLRPIFHRTDKVDYEEEYISFSDGGEMQLSWSNIKGMSDNTPIVVLLPGLTGCGCCSYIASLVKEINNCNYRCVVANNRGTCRHKLKTPKTYCAAHTSDVSTVFEHVRNRFPDASMVAVGISLGALLVFNYLADEQNDTSKPCPLTAAMCICMPWDVSQASDKLEKSLDWLLFNYPLTHGLRQLVIRNAEVLSEKYDVPRILKLSAIGSFDVAIYILFCKTKSRSIREFDESMTVGMFGYNSVDEYYADASPATKIHRVRIPILCLNAADDPFVPFQSLPLNVVNDSNSNVILALTRHGGHIGFLAGFLPTRPSLMDRAVPQFVSAVFEHKEEFDQFTLHQKDDLG